MGGALYVAPFLCSFFEDEGLFLPPSSLPSAPHSRPPPPPSPAPPAFVHVPHINCYPGAGAVALDDFGAENGVTSVDECAATCLSDARCAGLVAPRASDRLFHCWRLSHITLSDC